MFVTIVTAVIVFLIFIIAYREHKHRNEISEFANMLVTSSNLAESGWKQATEMVEAIEELTRRDQVESYNALEQGTNELIENYENDRLDLVEKIKGLEAEVESVTKQAEINANELGERIETYQRAQALHLMAILEYEKKIGATAYSFEDMLFDKHGVILEEATETIVSVNGDGEIIQLHKPSGDV